MSNLKILVLGPKINKLNGAGGAVVLFGNLIEELNASKINYQVIDTNKNNYKSALRAYISIIVKYCYYQKECDVVFFNSSRDYIYLLPMFFVLNTAKRNKIYLRKFGGELDNSLKSKLKGDFIKYLIGKLDGVFVESQKLVTLIKPYNPNAYWFPNVRKKNFELRTTDYKKKFVFISQIKASKGINELIRAFKELDSSYTLHFYGPVIDQQFHLEVEFATNIKYMGNLSADKVYATLNKYDVLVLPTYYEGEGYPGIIIEAYACGKPVITTLWKHIPEIVDNEVTGFLISTQSVPELKDAILKIDEANYKTMVRSSILKFNEFDSEIVSKQIFKILLN